MGVFAEQYCRRMIVAGIYVQSNVFLAPITGYTDIAFRLLAESYGAGVAFTEMVYVEDLLRGRRRAVESARFDAQEPVRALQLIGGDPSLFRLLCGSPLLSDVEWIDINMGCAIPEIVRSGRGYALVHDLQRASGIIEACKSSGKAVSVKCRPGMDVKERSIQAFARMCEDAGADLLTVHGRPGNQLHEGPVLYDSIADAKACISIPVIANGGIFSEEDAVAMMRQTGADGVMIGRRGLEDSRIFAALTGL